MWCSMYMRAVRTRPIATKSATASGVASAADVFAQSALPHSHPSESSRHSAHSHADGGFCEPRGARFKGWDRRRTLSVAIFGGWYSGVCQHFIFAAYARRWPIAGVAMHTRIRSSVLTVLTHQLGTYPFLYFPAFVGTTELVRGRTVAEACDRFRDVFWPNYQVGFVAWTPAMFCQFFFVPLPLQVLYISTCSLVWTTFLSWRTL